MIASCDKNKEKLEHLYIVDGNAKCYNSYGIQFGVFHKALKVKYDVTMPPIFPLLHIHSKLKAVYISFIIMIETTGCLPDSFPFTCGQRTNLSLFVTIQMISDQLWKGKY